MGFECLVDLVVFLVRLEDVIDVLKPEPTELLPLLPQLLPAVADTHYHGPHPSRVHKSLHYLVIRWPRTPLSEIFNVLHIDFELPISIFGGFGDYDWGERVLAVIVVLLVLNRSLLYLFYLFLQPGQHQGRVVLNFYLPGRYAVALISPDFDELARDLDVCLRKIKPKLVLLHQLLIGQKSIESQSRPDALDFLLLSFFACRLWHIEQIHNLPIWQ